MQPGGVAMSCWWDIDFSVTGPELTDEDDQFNEKTLSEMRFEEGAKLFHHVGILGGGVGYRAIHASRNYYGGLAIEELIARFPNLNFLGLVPMDGGLYPYKLFYGHGGWGTLN